jgi:glycine/sarcosine N-methyltransferase
MGGTARDFYDQLAGSYHLMFESWEASIRRQAEMLGPMLERECGPAAGVRVLDCSCGIGTQALGLAQRGFRMTGVDVSAGAIERARREAAAEGLDLPLHAVGMTELDRLAETGFDAAISMDNALPHLESEEQMARAAAQIQGKLRPGGLLLASIRDYNRLVVERPVVQGPAFYADAGRRRIVFQLWDWLDERRYLFHLYITRETPAGWATHHGVCSCRAWQREELSAVLRSAGFVEVKWLMPEESGYYQPIVAARSG